VDVASHGALWRSRGRGAKWRHICDGTGEMDMMTGDGDDQSHKTRDIKRDVLETEKCVLGCDDAK
jgi:hypothetical protein